MNAHPTVLILENAVLTQMTRISHEQCGFSVFLDGGGHAPGSRWKSHGYAVGKSAFISEICVRTEVSGDPEPRSGWKNQRPSAAGNYQRTHLSPRGCYIFAS
ncbi:MAG: hypothetical protein L6Q55_13770 [Azonexus sp.]|nr:hypothetical protein [Azonexus sp.]MCK6413470.1 hypothetical protein [Azonexus sp.]